MKSLRRILLEKLTARRPRHALMLSAAKLNVRGVELRIPPTSPLFQEGGGEVVYLPLDRVIAPWVLDHGQWQPEELAFLGNHLPSGSSVLIDVGANLGLITRQLLHVHPSIAAAICFEPHPGNFAYLQRNLAHLSRCHLVCAAIGERASEMTFYEDEDNVGNYSLNPDSMRGQRYRTSTVQCIPASEEQLLSELPPNLRGLPLVWKSDTQGFDETIVSTLPDRFWDRVHVGVMEISRIERPRFSRDRLVEVLARFPVRCFSDAPRRNLSLDEILEFSAGNDCTHADLCFARG